MYTGNLGLNPVGVGDLASVFPRVAEYSNPGLEDGSPSGKCPNSSSDKLKFVGQFVGQSRNTLLRRVLFLEAPEV